MKKRGIDLAIESLESDIAVLQLAVAKLRQQQGKPKPAARKPVAMKAVNEG